MKMVYDGWHKLSLMETVVKGKLVQREFLHLKDAVGAVITDSLGNVGLVEQYRPAVGVHTLEIPAGVLDKPGLTPKETLLEELEEECNIHEEDILFFENCVPAGFNMVTGSSNAYMNMFRVKVKEQPKETVVEDADVEKVIWVPFETLENLVKEGKIIDNKTIMAYFMLKNEV